MLVSVFIATVNQRADVPLKAAHQFLVVAQISTTLLMSIKVTQRAVVVISCIGSVYLFIYLFQHQRQRAQVTYMPVKSRTMNIYMLDNEQDSSLLSMKWQCL